MITSEQLQQWKELAEKATAGPMWKRYRQETESEFYHDGISQQKVEEKLDAVYAIVKIADYMIMTREAVPALIDEVTRLQSALSDALANVEDYEDDKRSLGDRIDRLEIDLKQARARVAKLESYSQKFVKLAAGKDMVIDGLRAKLAAADAVIDCVEFSDHYETPSFYKADLECHLKKYHGVIATS